MKHVRTFTVKRAGLRDPEPVVRLTPQESWDQVEMLRRLHEEFPPFLRPRKFDKNA